MFKGRSEKGRERDSLLGVRESAKRSSIAKILALATPLARLHDCKSDARGETEQLIEMNPLLAIIVIRFDGILIGARAD